MRFGRPANCPACHGRMRVSKPLIVINGRKWWMARLTCKNCGNGIQWLLQVQLLNGRVINVKKKSHLDIADVIREWNMMLCNKRLNARVFYTMDILGNNLTRTDGGFIKAKNGGK